MPLSDGLQVQITRTFGIAAGNELIALLMSLDKQVNFQKPVHKLTELEQQVERILRRRQKEQAALDLAGAEQSRAATDQPAAMAAWARGVVQKNAEKQAQSEADAKLPPGEFWAKMMAAAHAPAAVQERRIRQLALGSLAEGTVFQDG